MEKSAGSVLWAVHLHRGFLVPLRMCREYVLGSCRQRRTIASTMAIVPFLLAILEMVGGFGATSISPHDRPGWF